MGTTESPFLVFDFSAGGLLPQRLVFSRPVETLVASTPAEVRPLLRAVEAGVKDSLYAAGYVSYEAAPAFDRAFSVPSAPAMPLAWFGLFTEPVEINQDAPGNYYSVSDWTSLTDPAKYQDDISSIHDAIGRGDTYQVNYTMRLRGQFEGDSYALYERLRSAQKSHYCAYLHLGQHTIVSVSPELFFHKAGNQIVTRPMKGTAPRGLWPDEDRALGEWLQQSEKNRAENVMIVDLQRNDLGRIAVAGSVNVSKLFEIEKYPTVHQLTSTVRATHRPGVTLESIFEALFPCGSVTGAPKISTMRLIAQFEAQPREVYCGAIGVIAPMQTEMTFSVAIRTAWIDNATGIIQYGVGGGITWDSTCDEEYKEAMTKAKVLDEQRTQFDLLETLRLENGGYWLLSRHIKRLRESADYFGIDIDLVAVMHALDREAQSHAAGIWRVRLLVSADGRVSSECHILPAVPAGPLPIGLANGPVQRDDRFLYHKTTNRAVYAAHRALNPELFDVLLWNENREITEFTIGNIVVELGGEKLTPPIACGLLAGTYRAELLESGEVAERVLTIDDVRRASAIWLVNSVRGWVPVVLATAIPTSVSE